MAPPPPAGYPVKDGEEIRGDASRATTQSRGDGFWKGWLVLFTFRPPHLQRIKGPLILLLCFKFN